MPQTLAKSLIDEKAEHLIPLLESGSGVRTDEAKKMWWLGRREVLLFGRKGVVLALQFWAFSGLALGVCRIFGNRPESKKGFAGDPSFRGVIIHH